MHYVYFLLLQNGNIYKGRSNQLNERIKAHKQGKVKSTKGLRPFQLLGFEAYHQKSDAIRRENFLKTTEGKHLLRKQYRDVIKQAMHTITNVQDR